MGEVEVAAHGGKKRMTGKVFNVRFLCTGSSARSIIAEAYINTAGDEPRD